MKKIRQASILITAFIFVLITPVFVLATSNEYLEDENARAEHALHIIIMATLYENLNDAELDALSNALSQMSLYDVIVLANTLEEGLSLRAFINNNNFFAEAESDNIPQAQLADSQQDRVMVRVPTPTGHIAEHNLEEIERILGEMGRDLTELQGHFYIYEDEFRVQPRAYDWEMFEEVNRAMYLLGLENPALANNNADIGQRGVFQGVYYNRLVVLFNTADGLSPTLIPIIREVGIWATNDSVAFFPHDLMRRDAHRHFTWNIRLAGGLNWWIAQITTNNYEFATRIVQRGVCQNYRDAKVSEGLHPNQAAIRADIMALGYRDSMARMARGSNLMFRVCSH